jgi:Mce-associated membrane protein
MSRNRAIAAVIATCLPIIAAAVVFGVRTPSSQDEGSLLSTNTQTALAAAKTAVRTLVSYDYRTISADIAHAKAVTTGGFTRDYSEKAAQLLRLASQEKAIVRATVGAAGVVSAAPSTVVVLLFVDQASVRQTPGAAKPTTRIDQTRVRVTMSKVNGRWLVSTLEAL